MSWRGFMVFYSNDFFQFELFPLSDPNWEKNPIKSIEKCCQNICYSPFQFFVCLSVGVLFWNYSLFSSVSLNIVPEHFLFQLINIQQKKMPIFPPIFHKQKRFKTIFVKTWQNFILVLFLTKTLCKYSLKSA